VKSFGVEDFAKGCIISGNRPGRNCCVHAYGIPLLRAEPLRRSHVKRSIGYLAICVLLLGVSIKAQAPPAMPKPGPEVKKMAYFIGSWKEEGKSMMPGMSGPFSATAKWEWMPGGFFLLNHSSGTGSMGSGKSMAVMGYDPATKMYTYNEFSSDGEAITAKGTNNGDTWNWTADMMGMDGKPMKTKVTITQTSKTKYTFKMEMSNDGGATWMTGMEATDTKVTAAPAAAPAKKN
jgi:hypothetical protein